NSLYGNIAVTEKNNQYSFYYNGLPIITVPFSDRQFVEEFANFPLLFHELPQHILIIGNAAGGLISEILKQPVASVDYLELDPLLIKMLKDHPAKITQDEFMDPRVKVINQDARFFLNNTSRKYDVILIGLSDPVDLNTNRFFTFEFFLLAQNKLRQKGILALHLSGSLSYLSQELKNLNACILSGLKNSFTYQKVIPGDYNIILASHSKELTKTDASIISERIASRNIKATLLIPSYVEYRLSRNWETWFNQNIQTAETGINRDLQPLALFETLNIWNRKFNSNIFNQCFSSLKNLHLSYIIILVCAVTLLLALMIKIKKSLRISVNFAIFSTGFFGMLVNLILLFLFQNRFGYLYYKIGVLLSLFMAGAAVGSIMLSGKMHSKKKPFNRLIAIETISIIFLMFLAGNLGFLSLNAGTFIFMALFLVAGSFLGAEFSLANQIYLQKNALPGKTAATLYFIDLLGGWLAGILGGVVLLPVLGLSGCCTIIAFFKLSSLILLIFSPEST
ncbi:MAG: spermine synthase, partial [Candidatus Omnitrophica bacterium]|nr:spermine synthase [Candidatus Omnitrophota bacterium]